VLVGVIKRGLELLGSHFDVELYASWINAIDFGLQTKLLGDSPMKGQSVFYF
jgi:hypothetical protein